MDTLIHTKTLALHKEPVFDAIHCVYVYIFFGLKRSSKVEILANQSPERKLRIALHQIFTL